MIHLAIDTTTQYLKLAVYNTTKDELFELNEFVGRKQSEQLHVKLQELFEMASLKVSDIDNIIVNAGPGSYTSLRLGLAAAKGMALPFDINVVTVDSFSLLKSLYATNNEQAVIIENSEKQLYLSVNNQNYIIEPQEIKDYLKTGQEVIGSGFETYKEYLTNYTLIEDSSNLTAKDLIDYVIENNITKTDLEPLYIKPLSYKKYEYKL